MHFVVLTFAVVALISTLFFGVIFWDMLQSDISSENTSLLNPVFTFLGIGDAQKATMLVHAFFFGVSPSIVPK